MSSGPETLHDALSDAVETQRKKIPDIAQELTAICLFAGVNCPLVFFQRCAPRLRYEEVGSVYDAELAELLGDVCDFEDALGKTFEEISPVPFRVN